MTTWYETKTGGNHQGLIIEEQTGRNVAVAYDKADAPLIAAAPAMRAALRAILFQVVQGPVLERDACIAQAREAYINAGGTNED